MNYSLQFDAVFAAWPLLLEGTWRTIELSFLVMLGGLSVAIANAVADATGQRVRDLPLAIRSACGPRSRRGDQLERWVME
jgi:ABC-type amino acid transport system permease subunit